MILVKKRLFLLMLVGMSVGAFDFVKNQPAFSLLCQNGVEFFN